MSWRDYLPVHPAADLFPLMSESELRELGEDIKKNGLLEQPVLCRLSSRKPKVVPDAAHPGMWRVRWPDGRLSDMTNLTRAKDAVACFMETEERRRRGRHRPSEGRLCVKTGEMPAGGALLPASGEHGVVDSENGGARKQ